MTERPCPRQEREGRWRAGCQRDDGVERVSDDVRGKNDAGKIDLAGDRGSRQWQQRGLTGETPEEDRLGDGLSDVLGDLFLGTGTVR